MPSFPYQKLAPMQTIDHDQTVPEETPVYTEIEPTAFMGNDPIDTRLGKLLVDIGLVNEALLDHALERSFELGIPVGRALVMCGWLTEKQLASAIRVQSLLKEGLLSLPSAIRVGELLSCFNLTLEKALKRAGCANVVPYIEESSTRIGDFLVEAQIITVDELHEARDMAYALGLPTGRCLLLCGVITAPLLETVVNAQKYHRENKITREEAIAALKNAKKREDKRRSTINPDANRYPPVRSIRLGELLVLAGIVTDIQVQYALEVGLTSNRPIGEVLIEMELLTVELVEKALYIQNLVSQGALEPIEAAYTLIDVHHHGYSLAESIKSNRKGGGTRGTRIEFTEFLSASGIIAQDEIKNALESAFKSPYILSKALSFAGVMDETTVQVALCCHFYVREGMLSLDQAMLVYNMANKMSLSVEESIRHLGIKLRIQEAA